MREDLISRAELFNQLANVKTLEEAFWVIQSIEAVKEGEACQQQS